MPFYVWMLLLFAGWTVVLLIATVGVHRWTNILTGRNEVREFRADMIEGPDWYRRAMRAHANCVENLPVYAAVVVAALVVNADSPMLDTLAGLILVARLAQSTIHVALPETNMTVAGRFAFFAVQIVGFVWMGILVALAA